MNEILVLLGRKYFFIFLFANIIGLPMAYLLCENMYREIHIRTNIGIWVFLLSLAITIATALISITAQLIKTSSINLVDSLRCE